MKEKIKKYYQDYKKLVWILGICIILFIVWLLFFSMPKKSVTTVVATKTDLKSTILATGQVASVTDLSLSFPIAGVVDTLPISVGDKIVKGQILATLVNRSQYAALADAKANYQKVIDGSSDAQVAVAQAAVDAASANLDAVTKTQDTLLANAQSALLNVDLSPILTSGVTGVTPIISGAYTGTKPGSYVIKLYATGSGGYIAYSGIENGSVTLSNTGPVEIGSSGLYIQMPANYSNINNNVWTINLPNTQSVNYLTASNAYQNAQKTHDSAITAAQANLIQAQANLALTKSGATNADIAVAQAKVDQAQADYDNTIIYAPASGTVVHVNTKVGENVDSKTEAIVIQDINNLYVEANVNETSIAKIALGESVSMTLDAFGPNIFFTGQVIHIDPSATTDNGVVNYIVKTSVTDPSGLYKIRPGMNANMTITAWDHQNAITLPKVAIINQKDGTYVDIVTDDKYGQYKLQKVSIGEVGDGNLVEITSGLSGGEEIAILE